MRGLLGGGIRAVEDVDEFLSFARCLFGHRGEKGIEVGAVSEKRAVVEREVFALVDIAPFKVGVARGVCNLHCGHAGKTIGHELGVFAGALRLVEAQHRRDALRDSFGGDDDNLARSKLTCGLRGHDDVLVVGKDEHDLGGGLLDGL